MDIANSQLSDFLTTDSLYFNFMLKLLVVKYKVLEGVTTADVAYRIYGRNLEELFVNAAKALMATMVDMATVKPLQSSKFEIQSLRLQELFLDFLNELVFLKDAEKMVFSQFNVVLRKVARYYRLNADVWGENINPKRHKLKCDVKAVTRYALRTEKDKKFYTATIVLDI